MRTRSRVTDAGRSTLRYRRYDGPSRVIGTESISDMTYLGQYKEITDEVHPNFKASLEAGLPVIGPLTVTEQEQTITNATFTFPEGDSWHEYVGDLFNPFSGGSGVYLADRNSAIQSCKDIAAISALKKLNTAQVDTGEILGTLGSTISMFRRPFTGMHKLFAKMERQRVKRYGKLRKRRVVAVDESNRGDWYQATAETWLEYSFGFRPLFDDMSKTIKLYEDQVRLFESALRVAKGKSMRTVTGAQTSSYVHGGENPITGMVAETQTSVSEEILGAAGVYYKVPMNYSSVARGLGLGVHNLASSAWNLTPYSWLVDQVVNVGDWILAATPDPDLLVLGSYNTVKIKHHESATTQLRVRRARGNGAPMWYSGSGGGRVKRFTTIVREPGVTLPSTPQFSPNLSFLAQALNDASFGLIQIRKILTRFHH